MIQLPLMFSDHMMLQAEKPVRVFGTGDPGKIIRICLLNANGQIETETCSACGEDGQFLVVLPAPEAGIDRKMIISSDKETVEISDVAVGEVWLAGGQSNMEYLMHTDAEKEQEIRRISSFTTEERRKIRFFGYPEISFEGMEKLVDLSSFGKWRCLSEADLPYFSAVGYYFQMKLRTEKDVPVGILACNWGGTRACCWVPEETIRKAGAEVWIDEYRDGLQKIRDLSAVQEAYMKSPMNVLSDPSKSSPMNDAILFPGLSKAMQERAAAMMADADAMETYMALTPMHPWRPCGLYEHMLKKVAPYTVRGVIWYQGCSDESHADHYADLMHALILKWREDFQDPSLPFYQVQLAPFGSWLGNSGDNYPAVRSAQEKVSDLTSDTWLASIGDAGMMYDIHPKHKRKPGERLGLLALRHTYGLEISADAPRAKSLSYDGNTAVICFEHGEGLTVTDPENGGLTAEEMEKYNFSDPVVPERLPPAENLNSLIRTVPEGQVSAAVAEDTLRVSLSIDGRSVKPIKIAFAQTGYYEINLKNDSGLPVFPFSISMTS